MRMLAFWCRMCQCPTVDDFSQFARTLLQLPPGDNPLDLLELLSKQWKRTPERAIFDAMVAYLRGNYEGCLQLLAGLGKQARESAWNRWLATLWQGMAHASLDQPGSAQDAIRAAVADGMPQVLLLPFRWFKASKPTYFADYIEKRSSRTTSPLWKVGDRLVYGGRRIRFHDGQPSTLARHP